MIAWLNHDTPFPPLTPPLTDAVRKNEQSGEGKDCADIPEGLVAAGGDLSAARLLAAYRRGIFPWYAEGQPILWWSPDPRMVLNPKTFQPSRSLKKRMRQGEYSVTMDTAFASVIAACAAPRAEDAGTWILPEMQAAYQRLHALGFAHSVEVWAGKDLVGGLYGVALRGREPKGASRGVFFGESMFSRQTDASKMALAHLVHYLADEHYVMIDCQMRTNHLASLGAHEIPRTEFMATLDACLSSLDTCDFSQWPAGQWSDVFSQEAHYS